MKLMRKKHKFRVIYQWFRCKNELNTFSIKIRHKAVEDWLIDHIEYCKLEIETFATGSEECSINNIEIIRLPSRDFNGLKYCHVEISDPGLAMIFKLKFVGTKYDYYPLVD